MYNFLPLGTVLQGRYRIVRVLGGGGQGAVYLAEDLNQNRLHVAVKEMRSEAEATGEDTDSATAAEDRKQLLDSFNRESELLQQLRHPNMPTFTDAFTLEDRPYLVMEFIPGESLEKKLERRNGQPLPEREALYYTIQIAQVLRYLHSQRPPIIFRDVKPANIMVLPNSQCKLIDFGIARTYKVGKRKDTVSMGTAAYAPFEQFGKGQTDARSDIYSLAATLYHMLTGRPPTPATTPTGVRDLNPAVSPQTEALIIRAMDKDMSKRPQTALEFEQGLRDCLGIPFVPPEPWRPAEGPVAVQPPPIQGAVQAPPPAPVAAPSAPPPAPVPYTPPVQAPLPQPPVAVPPAPPPQAPVQRPVVPPPVTVPPAPALSAADLAQGPRCPVCGRINKLGARFCGACGTALGGRPAARLQVLGPKGVLWERPILENENPFTIGRRSISRNIFPHLDLTYSDPNAYISRRHAQIVANGRGYSIEDLGSENGTFVNDMRLAPNHPHVLRNGDIVQIGKLQMQFSQG
jgi:serine/threonine-protein kinase